MQPRLKRIMAIIDPTRVEQWALTKALSLAAAGDGTEVVAYACVYADLSAEDGEEMRRAETQRYELWIDRIIADASKGDIPVSRHIVWDRDWREAMHHAARQLEADLVIKRAAQARALGNSDRRLLRTVDCDVLLVNREPRSVTRRVLIAVNPRPDDDAHRQLEENVVDMGHYIERSQPDVELHAISAYPDSLHFIEPAELARQVGVERPRAHVMEGSAPKVISTTAQELDTDVVVMGAMAHHGVAGFTFSHTAEKVLNALRSDVLVVTAQA